MRGRRTKPCATPRELDRQLYRQKWHIAHTRPAGNPEGDAARAWLADRAAARKLAHPPRLPCQKKARARRAAKRQTKNLTPEEKARLCELRRIRYAVDDAFREKVNARNREYYLHNKARILAQHNAYNHRPETLERTRARARERQR